MPFMVAPMMLLAGLRRSSFFLQICRIYHAGDLLGCCKRFFWRHGLPFLFAIAVTRYALEVAA